ncbi:MAG TPA: hypothetical protein DDY54_04800 [Deltaproteobacteria bacterium]|nr:hypothetical protein [Deltaproteobacteria bacterium]
MEAQASGMLQTPVWVSTIGGQSGKQAGHTSQTGSAISFLRISNFLRPQGPLSVFSFVEVALKLP